MDLNDLKPGTRIKSKRWSEPVEIDKIDILNEYVLIIGSTINSDSHVKDLVPINEVLTEFNINTIEIDFSSDSNELFLAFETKRYRYASLYDPLLAVNTSKVDPLPHQIEAVYGYILKLPRIRFLIADDPGAGKTIMAGLIIKELKLRNLIKKVLIVVPGHLKDQWRRELKERFEEIFVVIDRGFMDSHHGENVWQKENQTITSIDFAKREEIIPSISSSDFDLVIVDEAHKMSAYKYGDKTTKSERYKLGEILSKSSNHLLFLTATPHKGDPENFRLFLDLLEPGFFSDPRMLEESIENKDNPLFIRRIKEDMKNFNGEPLFLPRNISTLKFKLYDKEKTLYNDVSKYVEEQYNRALYKEKKRNIAFALVILQRRLASSTYALFRSLERRRDKLEDLIELSETAFKPKITFFDFEEAEEMSEEERWKEEELWETLSVAENREELKKEIQILKGLIEQSKDVLKDEDEVKLNELKNTLTNLNTKYPNEKVIIFTESKDTLEYLEKKVRNWGYSVNTIHGGLKLDQRIEAEAVFKNEKQILIATEAAGEGINLQFCNLMINYDIPWNPNRLEQRMGRIHRYGQQKEVFIHNLVAEDTREGEVLLKIFDKLEEIKRNLGSDKVFDVIGEVYFGKNLQQLLMEAAAGARTKDEILKDVDIVVDEDYINRVKEDLGESLATRHIDYTRIKEMADKAREYKLIPEYTEAFFKKAFNLGGGVYRERKDEFTSIDSISYPIKIIADEDLFKRSFGPLIKRYPKVTFDKDKAFANSDSELISFGHPLFEAVLEYVERNYSENLKRGSVFIDPEGKMDGYILFYEGEIKDGTSEPNNIVGKRFFAIYKTADESKPIPPSILWDLAKGQGREEPIDLARIENEIIGQVISQMENYKKEKQEERDREASIKQKYGIKSLEDLILKLDGDIIELEKRKENGGLVDLPLGNKKRDKNKYLDALDELQDQIEREKTLTMGMPKFVGIIRVKPAKIVPEPMRSSAEIEKIGMEETFKHEKSNGRYPEDVSSENIGFDVRSTDPNGLIRYIEVKARAGVGDIALTQNEEFKARRLGVSYYLYVVYNAATKPDLRIIQNPAENLEMERKPEVVRYYIKSKEINEKGVRNG